MNKKSLPTYGEAWYTYKQRCNSGAYKFDDIPLMPTHKPKMYKSERSEYYRQKLNHVWKLLGYEKEEGTNEEVYYTPDLEGFDSVDDYFGYYEALKLREKLGIDCIEALEMVA